MRIDDQLDVVDHQGGDGRDQWVQARRQTGDINPEYIHQYNLHYDELINKLFNGNLSALMNSLMLMTIRVVMGETSESRPGDKPGVVNLECSHQYNQYE